MAPPADDQSPTLSRRWLLAAVGAAAGTTGCVSRLQAVASRTSSTQMELDIKTLPADEDQFAAVIAGQLAEWYRAAGIDASVLPVAGDELLRQILLTHDYDVFVSRFPGPVTDPDALYSLLHSTYAAELGRQNPFGYSSLTTDELLERQRRVDGEQRRETVRTLQETLLERNPFTVLAFPDRITAARDDRFAGVLSANLRRPADYFTLERTGTDERTLRLATTDPRPTKNLNPLTSVYRQDGTITGLIYDPLVRETAGEPVPWLASDVSWLSNGEPTARVTLRPDRHWHDGRDVTAADVAFTYEFMQDTSLGDQEVPVPATRYRGRSALVSSVDARDAATVIVRFVDCNRHVASRALTVPVLPAHVWRDRSGPATFAGVDTGVGTTEALVSDNRPAVGSGPLEFKRAEGNRRLVLERSDDPFPVGRDGTSAAPSLASDLAFEKLEVRVVGSNAATVELVAEDEADGTLASVGPDALPRIGRNDELALGIERSGSCYVAGYNARRSPLSNILFRGLLARLIDRAHLVSTAFDGYAAAAVSPLAATDWLPASLSWTDSAPTAPFLGENGTLDIDAVRSAFVEAGFRYDDAGNLLES